MGQPNLWAPWRMQYIRELEDAAGKDESACFLCDAAQSPDREHLVLLSDDRGMILLNKYPYINGHLLIAPPEHVATLSDLTADRRAGLMELSAVAEQMLQRAMNPHGLNVGINLGRCAGAGVPGHLHIHVLPRWHGDTNFMSVVGQVRVIPQALDQCYDVLSEALQAL